MKILEVLERVDRARKFEPVDVYERIDYCNNLGARLTQEIKKEYGLYEFTEDDVMADDGVLLPPYIQFEQIDRLITPGKRMINKTDFRSMNLADNGRLNFPVGSAVIYLLPYQPIRNIALKCDAEFKGTSNNSTIILKGNPFVTGDILNFAYSALSDNGVKFEDISIVDVEQADTERDKLILYLSFAPWYSSHGAPPPDNYPPFYGGEIEFERIITEETLCPAPYDEMYVHYCLARMAHVQHDYETYNAEMVLFNNLYDAYARWYKQCNPLTRDCIRNYW